MKPIPLTSRCLCGCGLPVDEGSHYRALCVSFVSIDEANEQLVRFFDAVKRARDEHHIADVVVIVDVPIMRDGEETRCHAFAARGDSARVLPMIAREFGAEQARHEARIAAIIAHAGKAARGV